jgi:hypothetical protein
MEDTTKTGETQTLDTTTVGQVDVNIDEIFGILLHYIAILLFIFH